METWYRFSKYRDEIDPIQVVRTTEKFLVVKGGGYGERRESKDAMTFPSLTSALDALVAHRIDKVARLREQLKDAEASFLAARKLRGDFND